MRKFIAQKLDNHREDLWKSMLHLALGEWEMKRNADGVLKRTYTRKPDARMMIWLFDQVMGRPHSRLPEGIEAHEQTLQGLLGYVLTNHHKAKADKMERVQADAHPSPETPIHN